MSSPSSLETSASAPPVTSAPPRERRAPVQAPTGHRQERRAPVQAPTGHRQEQPTPAGAAPRPPSGRYAPAGAGPLLWQARQPCVEGGLQLVGLPGPLLSCARPLLGLALLGLCLPEPRAELLVVGPGGGHVRLPVGRHGALPLQIPPRLLQRLIPIDEGCADPLEGGGTRRGLALVLQELVA
jgi:hypothetical protein